MDGLVLTEHVHEANKLLARSCCTADAGTRGKPSGEPAPHFVLFGYDALARARQFE